MNGGTLPDRSRLVVHVLVVVGDERFADLVNGRWLAELRVLALGGGLEIEEAFILSLSSILFSFLLGWRWCFFN